VDAAVAAGSRDALDRRGPIVVKSIVRIIVLAFLAASCSPTTAVINGQRVQRPTLRYTDGHYFAIEHTRAYPVPVGPSDGVWSYAGGVHGIVCGLSVRMEGDLYGRYLHVSGLASTRFYGTTRQLNFWVSDRKGVRHITGEGADLALTPTSLSGGITYQRHWRKFFLDHVEGNALVGELESNSERVRFTIEGVRELWEMPAVDQAALLPILLSCNTAIDRNYEYPIPGVDFRR
jgi:hypothetical protein